LTGPKLSTKTFQARQNFLNQRESRDETLECFLQAEATPQEEPVPSKPAPDAGPDSSDEEGDDHLSLEELDSMIRFLISGSSFEMLRTSLHSLVHPERAIVEALRTRNVGILETIFSKQFNRVAIGEFEWIKELESAGYTKPEIAQLLMDEAVDSPFIYFQPRISDATVSTSDACELDFHVAGCIHEEGDRLKKCMSRSHVSDNESLVEAIQELCGIAGVTPFSRNEEHWNGSLTQDDDNQTTRITYVVPVGTHPGVGTAAVLTRSLVTLKRLALAARYLQQAEGCCHSLSVIVHEYQC
jgi:hypothetical protein